ncbi:type IV secretion system DNA-binding domain-containing protein, partial [Vibrio sp. 10N.222.49.A3]|uniref:type IV secretion system DNA-binding domain-containing protein n=1 Tax=Vibrio sp. 10N.222.49.A3 TaxID=3229611 RepID=UPI00354F5535
MSTKELPPSQPYQDWGVIILSTLCLTSVLTMLVICISWDWFTTWAPIEKHLNIWIDIMAGFYSNDNSIWQAYREYLVSNNLEVDFIAHTLLPLIVAFSTSIMLCMNTFYVLGGKTVERHVAGSKRLDGKQANRHAKQQLSLEIKGGAKKGLHIHPCIQITQQSEIGNILITGQPGSGKTVIICSLLKQIITTKQKVFIFDAKQEYTEKFYSKNQSLLIAPWDKRSVIWNISEDMKHDSAPSRFAEHIISETKDRIWSESARLILVGIIESLKARSAPWGWLELYHALNVSEVNLRATLKQHSPKAMRFVEENNRTTQSILITMQSELGWIESLAKAWPKSYMSKFSIHYWVNNCKAKPTLILQAHQKYPSVGKPLFHSCMSMMVDEHLSSLKSKRCYLVVDELANLPKSNALLRWIELGRAQGGRTIAGTQAISQLRSIYGNDTTNSLTSMFSNLVTLKIGSAGDTAEFMSKALGQRVVERPQTQSSKATTASWQKVTYPIIYPSDLTQLPNPNKNGVVGFLTINGWSATYRLVWPYPETPAIAKKEVSATVNASLK